MSKFKCGDKVRLKADANFWGENHLELKKRVLTVSEQLLDGDSTATILECVEAYPEDFELIESAPQKHIHYDMIVEWAANPSRVIQFYDDEYYDCGWKDVTGQPPMWHTDKRYRFKPEEPERVFPTTSISRSDLFNLYDSVEHLTVSEALEVVANAATKCYILEQEEI